MTDRIVAPDDAMYTFARADSGDLADRYVLEYPLSHAASGVAWIASDTLSAGAHRVVVKFLSRVHADGDPDQLLPLKALLTPAQLRTVPALPRLEDFGGFEAEPYLVFSWHEGVPLHQHLGAIAAGTTMSLGAVTRFAKGLATLHGAGLLHLDIAPASLLYDSKQDTLHFIDWGQALPASDEEAIVKVSTESALYAGIGMLTDAGPSSRDDVYAAACLIHELLSGQHPYGRRSATEAAALHLEPAPLACLNASRNAVFARALNPSQEQPAVTMAELTDLLASAEREAARPVPRGEPTIAKFPGFAKELFGPRPAAPAPAAPTKPAAPAVTAAPATPAAPAPAAPAEVPVTAMPAPVAGAAPVRPHAPAAPSVPPLSRVAAPPLLSDAPGIRTLPKLPPGPAEASEPDWDKPFSDAVKAPAFQPRVETPSVEARGVETPRVAAPRAEAPKPKTRAPEPKPLPKIPGPASSEPSLARMQALLNRSGVPSTDAAPSRPPIFAKTPEPRVEQPRLFDPVIRNGPPFEMKSEMKSETSLGERAEPFFGADPVLPPEPPLADEPIVSREPVGAPDPVISREPPISADPVISREPRALREPAITREPVPSEPPVAREPEVSRPPFAREPQVSRPPAPPAEPRIAEAPLRARDPVISRGPSIDTDPRSRPGLRAKDLRPRMPVPPAKARGFPGISAPVGIAIAAVSCVIGVIGGAWLASSGAFGGKREPSVAREAASPAASAPASAGTPPMAVSPSPAPASVATTESKGGARSTPESVAPAPAPASAAATAPAGTNVNATPNGSATVETARPAGKPASVTPPNVGAIAPATPTPAPVAPPRAVEAPRPAPAAPVARAQRPQPMPVEPPAPGFSLGEANSATQRLIERATRGTEGVPLEVRVPDPNLRNLREPPRPGVPPLTPPPAAAPDRQGATDVDLLNATMATRRLADRVAQEAAEAERARANNEVPRNR